MDREGEDARRSLEETPDRVAPFEAAQRRTFPNRILGEQTCDPVGVVLVVAQGRIVRLRSAPQIEKNGFALDSLLEEAVRSELVSGRPC